MKCSIDRLFGKKGIELRDRGANGHSYVYIVWDDNRKVRYIGMASKQNVPQRMALHIGNTFFAAKPSHFSQILMENNPAYFKWTVEVLSVKEVNRRCARELRYKCVCIESAERAIYECYRAKHQDTIANSRPPNRNCRDRKCSHRLERS